MTNTNYNEKSYKPIMWLWLV